MKNFLLLLTATTAMGFASMSYAADESAQANEKVESKSNGGYTATSSSNQTDAAGTTETTNSKVDKDVISNGQVTEKSKVETTTDPKGLMNKSGDVVTTKHADTARGGSEDSKVVTHTDNNGTNTSTDMSKKVEVDKKGNVTETAKTTKTTDPKGLMNKKKTTHKVKKVNGTVVKDKTTSN